MYVGENRLVASDFGKARISEIVSMTGEDGSSDAKPRRCLYSPLWEADRNRIRRVAPLEFIGRYMPDRTKPLRGIRAARPFQRVIEG